MKKIYLYSFCCNWYLEVQTDCYQIVDLITNLFGDFIVSLKPQKNALESLEISIIKQENGYIMTGKKRSYNIKDLKGVAFYLYAVIDKLIEENMNAQFCVFHGGVVANNKNAYCIIAPTKTGKSTFITYCVCNGYEYIADDYVFVDRTKQMISPLCLPVCLRSTSVLEGLLLSDYHISGYNELRGENNTLVCLNNRAKSEYQFKNIIFLNRTNYNKISPMSKGTLYKSLLFNLKNTLDLERERIAVKCFNNNASGYELSFENMEYAKLCLDNMI